MLINIMAQYIVFVDSVFIPILKHMQQMEITTVWRIRGADSK